MSQPTAFVEFKDVQKSYDGEILVVKDLNLSIARGEFLTMLGPSGSGKTTCLMMLAGFEPVSAVAGDVHFLADHQGARGPQPGHPCLPRDVLARSPYRRQLALRKFGPASRTAKPGPFGSG